MSSSILHAPCLFPKAPLRLALLAACWCTYYSVKNLAMPYWLISSLFSSSWLTASSMYVRTWRWAANKRQEETEVRKQGACKAQSQTSPAVCLTQDIKHLLPQLETRGFFLPDTDGKIHHLNPAFLPGYTELVINSTDSFLESPEILILKEGKELWGSFTGKCLLKRSSQPLFWAIFPTQIVSAVLMGLLQSFRYSLPFPLNQSQVALRLFYRGFFLKVQIKVHLLPKKHQWMWQVGKRSQCQERFLLLNGQSQITA